MSSFDLEWLGHRLQLGSRTCIMGILNVTPDSFSDGGRFFAFDTALSHAEKLVQEGADILDIGGESTKPYAEPVTVEEETRRVIPVIENLAGRIPVPISIDTTKSVVARRAIDAGASIINDISALRFDPEMGSVAAKSGVLLILMHMKGTPGTMQIDPSYSDLIGEIYTFLENAIAHAESAGVNRSRIIVDPGIGFGKTVSHNLDLIRSAARFHALGVPLLLGPSRKAFIRKLLSGPENRNEPSPDHDVVALGTQAAVSASILNGAHILRVHNVAEARTTSTIIDAIRNA